MFGEPVFFDSYIARLPKGRRSAQKAFLTHLSQAQERFDCHSAASRVLPQLCAYYGGVYERRRALEGKIYPWSTAAPKRQLG